MGNPRKTLGTAAAGLEEEGRLPAVADDAELRRARVLAECARILNSRVDISVSLRALAGAVVDLSRGRFAVLLLRDGDSLRPLASAAESPQLAQAITAAFQQHDWSAAQDLVSRAGESGELVTGSLSSSNGLEELLPSGQAVAVPLRTPRSSGALLVVSRPRQTFDAAQKALISALANTSSLALSNAELSATVSAQSGELRQLVEMAADLGAAGGIQRNLPGFLVRAADFLGFARAFVAVREGEACHVRWLADEGQGREVHVELRPRLAQRVFATREPFWCDDASQGPETGLTASPAFSARQYLLVPLPGNDGEVHGLFALLDRTSGGIITQEDVRRASALAAQLAMALDSAANLRLSEQHRQRAESLMGLARELNSSFRLPDFIRSFTVRSAEMLGARTAAMALAQGKALEVSFLNDPAATHDRALLRRLGTVLTDLAAARPQAVVSGAASELLTPAVASSLGWTDLAVARLAGPKGELLGMLCLAERGRPLSAPDRSLLEALAGHAAVAVENALMFSRMENSSKQWTEIFDAITDFIVVHDENNRILRVNRTLADFIGVHPAELIGVTMRALVSITSETGSGHPCPFCRSSAEAGDEYIHPALERTYLISTSRLHGEHEEALQTIHILKDISDRREAERRYRELFDNIQEGLFFSTPEGRFIEVNDALVRMLGYASREELLQVDIPTQLYTSSGQRQRFSEAIDRAGVLRNFEETLRRKDGSLIHTLQNAIAVRDPQGRVVQYRGVILDITELKTFQSQLQRERDFNRKILNNTQSMIMVVDTAGLISYANRRCFEAGAYKENDLLGHRLEEFVAPPRRARLAEAFAATLNGQQVDNLELPFLRGDGGAAQFSVNLSPMRDDQGNPTSIVAVMTDVTDAAMLQAKLRHTEKMAAVGQLVSGVAHEVNNPLTAILGFAELLADQPDVPDSARGDLRLIIQEAQRTKVIVQNLLSFARQMPPQRKPMQVNTILRRTLQLRSYDFSSHGVDVVEHIEENLPDIVGDSHQLQQVFLNILNNAYDAVRETGRRGHIEIETGCVNGFVEITFRDNGSGIAYPERIFDPFFTTKEVGKGTGLGLSICYGIVREHGGDITCANNTTQPGAWFKIRLPVVGSPEAAAAALRSEA
ncbi:MAG TPA: PAS domain S-box protein [Terriglobales bacterium]|nr:PAS domain S-box protein [Terriglobales bacterium]